MKLLLFFFLFNFFSNGTEITTPSRDALYGAVYSNDLEKIRQILKNGTNINSKNRIHGDTPLHYVRSLEITKLLIDNGADVNAKNNEGYTPLHNSARRRYEEMFCFPFKKIRCDYTKSIEIINFLIDNGADVNAFDNDGDTPCDVANVEELKKLIKEKVVFVGT